MKTFCLKCCKVKHLRYLPFIFVGIYIFRLILQVLQVSDDNGHFDLDGFVICISIIGGAIFFRIGFCIIMYLLVKAFPVSFENRKGIFSGISSLPLETILLNIDNGFPAVEGVHLIKDEVLLFLEEIKLQVERASSSSISLLFAGSIEEKFGIPYSRRKQFNLPSPLNALYSDYDVMFCSESYNATFSQSGNILIDPLSPTSGFSLPAFAQIIPLESEYAGDQPLNSMDFLKSLNEAVKHSNVDHLPGLCTVACGTYVFSRIRGPAIKITSLPGSVEMPLFEGDITFCIKCPEWPPFSNWPTRTSRMWPSKEDVQRISSNGIHLIAFPLSVNKHQILPSWRYSFSMAEVELSKLVPASARKCFLALKIIHKDHLKPTLPELSSYHIKTVFLNTLEKKPESFWVDDNIEECFQTLLHELHHCLETGNCKHYWFEGLINLFGRLKSGTIQKRLSIVLKKMELILEDPAPFVCDDGCCCICACCNCCCKEKRARKEDISVVTNVDSDSSDPILQQPTEAASYGTFPQGVHDIV